MDSNVIYRLQAYLDNIGTLCYLLDIVASPNIEKELDACIDDHLSIYIETLINSDETVSIIGRTGLQTLHKLHAMIPEGCCYRDGKGFSTTQRWLDFVNYTKMVNALLKDAVKKYVETTENIK
jgi:hypothetical protein